MRLDPPARSTEDNLAIARQLLQLAPQAFFEPGVVVMEAQQAMLAAPAIDTSRPAMFDVDIGAARYPRRVATLLAAEAADRARDPARRRIAQVRPPART